MFDVSTISFFRRHDSEIITQFHCPGVKLWDEHGRYRLRSLSIPPNLSGSPYGVRAAGSKRNPPSSQKLMD